MNDLYNYIKTGATMKKLLAVIAGITLFVTSGCAILEDHKDQIHSAVVELVQTKGADAAYQYLDKLEEQGRIGSANAQDLRKLIPQIIEKLKQ